MIDKDGIERPDKLDEHIIKIKNQKRKVVFDDKYPYRPRNIFFRLWSAFCRLLLIAVFNPCMVLKYHLYIFGNENRKKLRRKSFVMTVNHVHYFDHISVGTNLFCWRKIYYTTLDLNIKRPFIGFLLRSFGGIPLPSGSISGMKKFNEDVSYLLKHKKPILYSPESSLWPFYREIRPYKRGAFSVAVKNDVPVLPIVLLFKQKKKKNKVKHKMYFAICKPVEIDKSLPDERSRSEKLMKQVYEVTKRVAEEWYEIQDCGYGDEKISRKLRHGKDLVFKDDQWIVKEKKKQKSKEQKL